MRYDVALAACKSYEDAEVSAALETAGRTSSSATAPAGCTTPRICSASTT